LYPSHWTLCCSRSCQYMFCSSSWANCWEQFLWIVLTTDNVISSWYSFAIFASLLFLHGTMAVIQSPTCKFRMLERAITLNHVKHTTQRTNDVSTYKGVVNAVIKWDGECDGRDHFLCWSHVNRWRTCGHQNSASWWGLAKAVGTSCVWDIMEVAPPILVHRFRIQWEKDDFWSPCTVLDAPEAETFFFPNWACKVSIRCTKTALMKIL
jgi:hypothetical protein